MRRRLSIVLVLAGLIAGLVPSPVLAGPRGGGGATIPFEEDDCGSTIETSVRLVDDVDCSAVINNAINIGAEGVTVDLGGHTLTVAHGYYGVDTYSHGGVTVTGSTIVVAGYGSAGVVINTSSYARVSGVTVTGSGTDEGYGIYCYGGTSATITGVTASNLNAGVASNYCTMSLSSSTLSDNEYGYYSYYDGAITVTGITARGNRIGVYTTQSARFSISRSLAEANNFGFYLFPDGYGTVTVSGCTARDSVYSGTYDYTIDDYDGVGFVVRYAYDYSGSRSTVSNSSAIGNGHYGFYLSSPGPLTFKGNSALGNGNTGVDVYGSYGNYGPVYGSQNTARDNYGFGFWSDYAVVGTGNKMSGNYYTYECPGWTCTVSR